MTTEASQQKKRAIPVPRKFVTDREDFMERIERAKDVRVAKRAHEAQKSGVGESQSRSNSLVRDR